MTGMNHETHENFLPSIPEGIGVITLNNGLTLILKEDHAAPVVSVQAWCKAGSIHEGKWMGAGLSHVLEHMLFKGTTKRPPGQIDREVQEAGGNMNAYTSFDRTVYHIDVPNTGIEVAIDILCDILQNATIPEDELEKEKQVILREMDMNVDNPRQRSARRLFEVAYTRSPYRYTVIGYPDIFNAVQRADIMEYYHDKYAPNNVIMVIVGDFVAADAEKQVRQAFDPVKSRPLPPVVLPEEPPQVAPREIVEEGSTEMAQIHMSWHIPDIRHPDMPLLDVLSFLLGCGDSSRLYQVVREQKALVNSVGAWTYAPGMPGLFGISASTVAGKYEQACAAMLAELERMKKEPVSPAELSKAVKQFVAGTLATRKTMAGQAQDLGANWLAANDLNFSERYLAAVKRITPADLQRVAHTYLNPENRTLFALMPHGTRQQAAVGKKKFVSHPIQKHVLANGLRLLIKEDHRLPFVDACLVFQAGVLRENPQNSGIGFQLARMLMKGTANRTAEQIALEMESLGGSMDTYAGTNSLGFKVETMQGDFETGFDVLADAVLNPAFPPDHFEREQMIQLNSIQEQRDHVLHEAMCAMRRALYGQKGYGLDILGTEPSVQNLTPEKLRGYSRELMTPNNCVMAIFGDVDVQAVQRLVEEKFGNWSRGGDVSVGELSEVPAKVLRTTELRDKKQAVVVIGFAGASMHDDDRFALELLQEACSDMGSRLFVRIRDNLGLAYYVGAANFSGIKAGHFAFYAGTEPDKVEVVEKEILREVDLLRSEGLTEEELKRCKAKIVGQKKIARQDLAGWAVSSALDELFGLGYDRSDLDDARFEAVTLEEVRKVACKYLLPDAAVISMVLPQKTAE